MTNNHDVPSCSLHPHFTSQTSLYFTNTNGSSQFLTVIDEGITVYNNWLDPGQSTPEFVLNADNEIHWANDSFSVVDYRLAAPSFCVNDETTTTTTPITVPVPTTVPEVTTTTAGPTLSPVPDTTPPSLVPLPTVPVSTTVASGLDFSCVVDANGDYHSQVNGRFTSPTNCGVAVSAGHIPELAVTGAHDYQALFVILALMLVAIGAPAIHFTKSLIKR